MGVFVLASCVALSVTGQASFLLIDPFNPSANAISADGSVVAGSSLGQCWRWTAATGVQYVIPSPRAGIVSDMSADGTVIVGRGAPSSDACGGAFIWSVATDQVTLCDLPGGQRDCTANGISADGTIVVGHGFGDTGIQAVKWVNGGPAQPIGVGVISYAHGISADGSTIVGQRGSPASAFVVGPGGGPNAGPNSLAKAASSDGSVIVGTASSQAFRWSQVDGLQLLGDLPGGSVSSQAMDVTGDGSVVVGFGSTDEGSRAFIWDAEKGIRSLRDALTQEYGLRLDCIQLVTAQSISADGSTISGVALNVSGVPVGFIARLWGVQLPGAPTRPCPGDANNDRQINAADLSVMLAEFGLPCDAGRWADFNNDGQVDGADLSVLLSRFGGAC